MEAVLKNDAHQPYRHGAHCETTGMLNPLQKGRRLAAAKTSIVDAMSSFGGIPLDVDALGIDFLISSANKCIQGCRGSLSSSPAAAAGEMCRPFALAVAGSAQWRCMENQAGKWRFTSPTHTVLAFAQALKELEQEGRHCRAPPPLLSTNQAAAGGGMRELGFETLLDDALHSPIITAFYSPKADATASPGISA